MRLRWVFCILLLFLFIPAARSQVGLKAGIGVSDIVFSDEGQTPYLSYEIDYIVHRVPLLAFQLGAFYSIPLNKKIYFQPELLFARQGLDYDIEFLYDKITYQIHINYLQAPLLFCYKANPEKRSRPGIFVGPYVALKLNAVREVEIEDNLDESDASNIKPADFGIMGGFSMEFELPSGKLSCELRTSYGLVNMMDRIDGYIPRYYGPENEKARNTSIMLMIGYRFSKGISKEEIK